MFRKTALAIVAVISITLIAFFCMSSSTASPTEKPAPTLSQSEIDRIASDAANQYMAKNSAEIAHMTAQMDEVKAMLAQPNALH